MNIQPHPASAHARDIETGLAEPSPPPAPPILPSNTDGTVVGDADSMAVLIEMGRAERHRPRAIRQAQQVAPPVRTPAAPATTLARLQHLSRETEREPWTSPRIAFIGGGAIGAASGIACLSTTSLLSNVAAAVAATFAVSISVAAFLVTGSLAAVLTRAHLRHLPLMRLRRWLHALDLPTSRGHELSGNQAREAVSLLNRLVLSEQADPTLPDRLRAAILAADHEGGLIAALRTIPPANDPGRARQIVAEQRTQPPSSTLREARSTLSAQMKILTQTTLAPLPPLHLNARASLLAQQPDWQAMVREDFGRELTLMKTLVRDYLDRWINEDTEALALPEQAYLDSCQRAQFLYDHGVAYSRALAQIVTHDAGLRAETTA